MTAKSEFKVSMEDRKQTYVIIPAYNEEKSIDFSSKSFFGFWIYCLQNIIGIYHE